MSSRSHVVVSERRLRPIYDCLDNGNNKKAIQEADKVLKKQRNFQCAKVLKALALLRLGRHDESAAILQEVHAEHPDNEATLQAMSICYREVHKLELIADLYENAHKSRPDHEEILSCLFMAHVRLGDYKKQQQTAMLLHKLKPQKNPYYFWAVMSIVMQAHSCQDQKLAASMYLPLAERMTKKYITDGKIEAEAEVLLYLMILDLLKKYDEAIDLLEGPLGVRFVNELNFRAVQLAELYTKLERWSKANAAYKKLLQESPDHWQFWKEYLNSAFHLVDSEEKMEKIESELEVDDTVEKVIDFLNQQIKGCENGRPYRGPYLAQLQLAKLLLDRKHDSLKLIGSPLGLMKQYFDRYGDRSTYIGDMKLFVDILKESEQQELIQHVTDSLHLSSNDGTLVYASSVKQLQRHISVLQLSRYLGYHDSLAAHEKIAKAKELISRHKDGLKFGKNLPATDLQFSDPYLILAAHLLLDAAKQLGSLNLIWQVVIELEQGMRQSQANFQIKLLLIRLYCSMSAFGPCPALYDGMEIKHIMNDTLGHTVSSHVGRLGHFVAACAMYGTMLRFFTVNHKETTEYLLSSYKYGSFGKICEFVKFREKLQDSIQYASATAERLLLDLILDTYNHSSTEQMITYMEIDPEQDKTNFDKLRDNRDYKVMSCWDPPSRFNLDELQQQSFKEEKAWLRLRNLTLRLLAACVKLGHQFCENSYKNGVTNGPASLPEVIQELLKQLESHVDICQSYISPAEYPFQGPYPTRMSSYLQGEHHRVLTTMVKHVLYVNSVQENGLDEYEEKKIEHDVPGLFKSIISKCQGSLLSTDNNTNSVKPDILEKLVLCTETLAHATILCGVCQRLLKPLKSSWSRKMKKKKDVNPVQPCIFSNFSGLVSGLIQTGKDLNEAVKNSDPVFLSIDLSSLQLTPVSDNDQVFVEHSEEVAKEMWSKVERSYQQSAREMIDLVNYKIQYLHSLKL